VLPFANYFIRFLIYHIVVAEELGNVVSLVLTVAFLTRFIVTKARQLSLIFRDLHVLWQIQTQLLYVKLVLPLKFLSLKCPSEKTRFSHIILKGLIQFHILIELLLLFSLSRGINLPKKIKINFVIIISIQKSSIIVVYLLRLKTGIQTVVKTPFNHLFGHWTNFLSCNFSLIRLISYWNLTTFKVLLIGFIRIGEIKVWFNTGKYWKL